VYLVKMGVQIATRPTWAFQDVPPKGGYFWREEKKCSTLLVSEIHLKLVRKIVSVKKIQAEALP